MSTSTKSPAGGATHPERDLGAFLWARGSTTSNPTGTWRFAAPTYIEALPPCSGACPAGTDVRGWLKVAGEARLDEAARHYILENPFPAITGRVCHRPCESVCSRAAKDGTVEINAIERALGATILDEGYAPVEVPERARRVAVVGSGPAGMSAAYYLRRLGYPVTVFEAAPVLGGMLRLGIPPYRLPRDVLDRHFALMAGLGVEFRTNVRVDLTHYDGLDGFDAIFVATGLHASRPLPVEGAEYAVSGVEFLRRLNLGNPLEVGERVVVIGGGDVAVDCARSALRLGAKSVTMAAIEPRDRMRAHHDCIRECAAERVGFVNEVLPESIADRGGVRTILFSEIEMPLGGFQSLEDLRVKRHSSFAMKADTVIYAIGQVPQVRDIAQGVQRIGHNGSGRERLVLVGGDADGGDQNVARAIGSGKWGAMRIHERFEGRLDPEARPSARVSWVDWSAGRPTNARPLPAVNDVYFPDTPHAGERPCPSEPQGWREVGATIAPEAAAAEARRCFHCGSCTECDNCLVFCPDTAIHKRSDGFGYVIDYDHCKGCGVCVQECPRGSMLMVPEAELFRGI